MNIPTLLRKKPQPTATLTEIRNTSHHDLSTKIGSEHHQLKYLEGEKGILHEFKF